MGLKTEQNKLDKGIDSIKLVLQSMSDMKKIDLQSVGSAYLDTNKLKKKLLGDGSGKSVNTDFIGKLVNTLLQSSGGGPDKVKTFVKKIIKKVRAPPREITIECQINFSALSISFAPMLLAIADVTAPPRAPPDIV